ncbi:transmembrane protein, putative [Medicago truncatula]|uniref:Transmembrane protein, putative n=1 Tax=Medicago truncatula TaxID=3880 RepID=A0A072UN32_MEDTR|nr:transmembrane protein, putative [Medicago truncatula]
METSKGVRVLHYSLGDYWVVYVWEIIYLGLIGWEKLIVFIAGAEKCTQNLDEFVEVIEEHIKHGSDGDVGLIDDERAQ